MKDCRLVHCRWHFVSLYQVVLYIKIVFFYKYIFMGIPLLLCFYVSSTCKDWKLTCKMKLPRVDSQLPVCAFSSLPLAASSLCLFRPRFNRYGEWRGLPTGLALKALITVSLLVLGFLWLCLICSMRIDCEPQSVAVPLISSRGQALPRVRLCLGSPQWPIE